MSHLRVFITGVGALTPAGDSINDYFRSLLAGECNIRPLVSRMMSNASIAGNINFLNCQERPRHEAFAIKAIREALEWSSLPTSNVKTGLSFGTAIGSSLEIEQAYILGTKINPNQIRFGGVTDSIATLFEIAGPRYTLATGCVAGIDAIGTAFDSIVLGEADAMVAAAADATITPIVFAAFDKIGALSKRNLPFLSSQPFDSERDGFVLGEGAAAMILESENVARQRSAKPLAEILGWHSISNAFHMTRMRTDGQDLVRLILELLAKCGRTPNEVDVIDVHGTSTVINDLSEANTIQSIFCRSKTRFTVTAQKGNIGHLLGAASAVEIAAIACMISGGSIPPIIGLSKPDEAFAINFSRKSILGQPVRLVLKLSSSFSGIHSAMLLAEIK